MTRPRSELVCPAATPWYHCVCRCVRRAFLCGEDRLTGHDYSHRKQWVLERLALLSQVFCIDLGAYAVMANHYHLVVRLAPERAASLSDEAVVTRWSRLFALPTLVSRWQFGENLSDTEKTAALAILNDWRERLADLSWYMRCLNEHIARRANAEEACSGRFWEGRFKSQAILDDAGLLACLVYVDLNPLRAQLVATPEASPHISLKQRIDTPPEPAIPLLPFIGNHRSSLTEGLPYTLTDYLHLVDWTGRIQRPDRPGYIAPDTPPILSRLGIESADFLATVSRYKLSQGSVIGCPLHRRHHAKLFKRRRLMGRGPSFASP